MVFRRETEAKEIFVAVVITFDAKSSESEEILVHHSEDKKKAVRTLCRIHSMTSMILSLGN